MLEFWQKPFYWSEESDDCLDKNDLYDDGFIMSDFQVQHLIHIGCHESWAS